MDNYAHQHEPLEQVEHEITYKSVLTDDHIHRFAPFLPYKIITRCRSPPLVLRFQSHFENLEDKHMKEYTLIVKGRRVPVTYEVYKAYYQEYEHERYLKNKAAKHEHSLEQFIETGVSIEFNCLDSITPVEDEVLIAEQIAHLYCCLDNLSAQEQQIIRGLFFEEKTERALAKQLEISASAIGYRKRKVLKALFQEMRDYHR